MEREPELRPFLPRPGETAEAYAARLRRLVHDLELLLGALEYGRAAGPEPRPPAGVRVEVVPGDGEPEPPGRG